MALRLTSLKSSVPDCTVTSVVPSSSLMTVFAKYLRKIFELEDNDRLLLSYVITHKQKKYVEKLSRLNIDLEKYDYFMES